MGGNVIQPSFRPEIDNHGIFASHNVLCWWCEGTRPAVYDINRNVFLPCWACQRRKPLTGHRTRWSRGVPWYWSLVHQLGWGGSFLAVAALAYIAASLAIHQTVRWC